MSRFSAVSGNKGLKSYETLWHLNQWTFQMTLIFCGPIFSQLYWPSYSAKEYLVDHSQCLTCCYWHVLYLEVKPSKCKKYKTLLHFWGKWNSNEWLSGRTNNNTDEDSCWYSECLILISQSYKLIKFCPPPPLPPLSLRLPLTNSLMNIFGKRGDLFFFFVVVFFFFTQERS